MSQSQIKQIKAHLQSGKTLTPLEALAAFGTFRLAARVLELKRPRHGMKIVTDVQQDSHGKTFAVYQEESAWKATHKIEVGSRVIVNDKGSDSLGSEAQPGDCGRVVEVGQGSYRVQFNKASRAHMNDTSPKNRGLWFVATTHVNLMPGQGVARAH